MLRHQGAFSVTDIKKNGSADFLKSQQSRCSLWNLKIPVGQIIPTRCCGLELKQNCIRNMTQAIRGGCIIRWAWAIGFSIAVVLPRLICIIAEIVGISIGE